MELDFNKLDGEKASLYYTNLMNSFQLGSVIFEVIDDENDGYRSSMQEVKIVDLEANKTQLLGEVVVRAVSDYSFEGFELIDTVDGHVWLRFGTDSVDDYYPCFIYDWTPKDPPTTPEKTNFDAIKQKIK